MTPKISVIIPFYNAHKYLTACLNSILNQTYQNLEIILIDDGSTDNSLEIAQSFKKQDPRIQIFTQKNRGPSAARNLGLKKATGDFISFIDSDDTINPDFLTKLKSVYTKSTSLSLCAMNYFRVKSNTTKSVYTTPPFKKRKHESNASFIMSLLARDGRLYPVTNKLFRADIIKSHQLFFNESINFAEYTEFVLTYIKHTPCNIAFILEPLYNYNFGTETSTVKKSGVIWQNWQNSYNFLKNWVGDNPSAEERFWLFLIYCRWRISYLRSKHRAR